MAMHEEKCPEHGYNYVSLPRDSALVGKALIAGEENAERYLAKCPLRYCFHGIERVVEEMDFSID